MPLCLYLGINMHADDRRKNVIPIMMPLVSYYCEKKRETTSREPPTKVALKLSFSVRDSENREHKRCEKHRRNNYSMKTMKVFFLLVCCVLEPNDFWDLIDEIEKEKKAKLNFTHLFKVTIY